MSIASKQHGSAGVLLALTLLASGATARELTLIEDGVPRCAISIAAKPTVTAQFAALELQWHLREMSGAEVPIIRGVPGEPPAVPLYVGPSVGMRKLDVNRFAPFEFAVAFRDDAIVLAGQDEERFDEAQYADPLVKWSGNRHQPRQYEQQGSLHAVYEFMERFLGVRWFNPTEVGTEIPSRRTVVVTAQDIRRKPGFCWRAGLRETMPFVYEDITGLWHPDKPEFEAYTRMAYAETYCRYNDNYWQGRVHCLGTYARRYLARMKFFGSEQYVCNHSFYGYYTRFWEKSPSNPDAFEGKRTDWFGKPRDHLGRPAQMCYTNDAFIRQVVQDARDYFDGKGKKTGALAEGDYFALCPMDNSSYCQCPKCQALINRAEEENPSFWTGTYSDLVFGFANRVATEVAKTHPAKYLSTLSYARYTYYPRGIELSPNLSVQLCLSIRVPPPFDTPEWKRRYDDWVDREKQRRLFAWLYYCHPLEFANRTGGHWHVFPPFFARNIDFWFKRFHRDGVRGLFFNGTCRGADAYVTFKLMDRPERDLNEVLDEYFNGYYKDAAAPMKQFYQLVQDRYLDRSLYPPGAPIREEVSWSILGNAPTMARLQGYMDKARRLTRDPIVQRRLDLFEQSTWLYMVEGRREYLRKVCPKPDSRMEVLHVPFQTWRTPEDTAIPQVVQGACVLGRRNRLGELRLHELEAHLATDGARLHIDLLQATPSIETPPSSAIEAGPHMHVLFAPSKPTGEICELFVAPDGRSLARRRAGERTEPWEHGGTAKVLRGEAVGWRVRLSLPLDALEFSTDIQKRPYLRFNAAATLTPGEEPAILTPTIDPFRKATRYILLYLDKAPAEEVTPSDEGLAARWTFDEMNGKAIADVSGQGHNGEAAGRGAVETEPALFGKALKCSRRYLSLPADDRLVTGDEPYTVEVWCRPEPSIRELWRGIAGVDRRMKLTLRPSVHVSFDFWDKQRARWIAPNSTRRTQLSHAAWNHIVAVYGEGGKLLLCVNGIVCGTGACPPGLLPKAVKSFRVGGNIHFRHSLGGWVDDVRVYNRAMTAGEAQARFRAVCEGRNRP